MPLPLIPIIGWGVAAVTAAYGAKKGYDAYEDKSRADELNDEANETITDAKSLIEVHRIESGATLENLGAKKLYILDNEIKNLVDTIENIEVKDSVGLNELKKFKIDKQDFVELKEMSGFAASMLGGTAAGAMGGALAAFGAYSAAGMFATASTGASIAGLSGVAATNATLAFFGGGSLAAGGLGVAGGMAVLGGLVAGPALAVVGAIAGAKAEELKHQAYANRAKAKEFAEEMKTAAVACDGIRRRANMFYRLLVRLSALAAPINAELIAIADKYRNPSTGKANSADFSDDELNVLAMSLATLKCAKTVLDTPLLTENGELTPQSAVIAATVDGETSKLEKQRA